MAYISLRRDYQNRTATSGWRFAIKHLFKNGSCPYNLGHCAVQNRLLGDLLFEKWNKRPGSAHKLYWRTHPTELEATESQWRKNMGEEILCKYGEKPSDCHLALMDCQCILDESLSGNTWLTEETAECRTVAK